MSGSCVSGYDKRVNKELQRVHYCLQVHSENTIPFFFRTVLPLSIVVLFVVVLGVAIEEYVASQTDYRVTIWDHLVGRDEVPQGRAEVSQQVAVEICRQKAAGELGRQLLLSRFDQRSSRYNSALKVHTVFVNLTVKNRERDAVYIRCDISAVNRMILESRIKGISSSSFFGG